MTEATRKRCRRCGLVLPAKEFSKESRLRDGLASWCRQCVNERRREWRAENPAYNRSEAEIKRGVHGYADPVAFSRAVCEHVSAHVGRAIDRFERKTGKEAPPHLTTIRDLALSFAEQHPVERNRVTVQKLCESCGNAFHTETRNMKRCHECQTQHRRESNNESHKRRYWEDPEKYRAWHRENNKKRPERDHGTKKLTA